MNNPVFGHQFFGEVTIEAATEVMTVRFRDINGAVPHTTEIPPRD
ncbi:hypothetical protein FHU38_000897 [Saccharomonospora amisosensis]|uniref:Uncharacterized protein n=1 Tax=Saccharomonospora amisosensis TaxID=1128677 RepID=A0A7X5ZP89_9PSEU|nr:hypothetical protein [Saccharomonospora amisosensis]NIJ10553.1 hypothetical protein [Saccharomonospora amisosensis]